MDTELRKKITAELKSFLKRDPTEKEIMNAQTDVNIMQKVRDKELSEVKVKVDKQELAITALKPK